MRLLDPDAQLGYLLVRAAHEVSRSWLAAVRRHGINPTQFGTLAILAREPASSQGELARRVMVTPQSMSDSIGALVSAGLLVRHAVERGRTARLEVTAEGKAVLRRAYPVVEAANDACFTMLSSSQRRNLKALLGKVLEGRASTDSKTVGAARSVGRSRPRLDSSR